MFAAALLVGCTAPSGPHFKHFRRLHPDWEQPEHSPAIGVGLLEVLAVIDAPPRRRTNSKHVWTRRVFEIHEDHWAELLDASFLYEDEAPEPNDYFVLADTACFRREPPGLIYSNRRYQWYFLRENQLVAFRNSSFEIVCSALDFSLGEPPALPPGMLTGDELQKWDLLGEPDAEI